MKDAHRKLRTEIENFPFRRLEHSIEIEQVIGKVSNLVDENIKKVEVAVDSFHNNTSHLSPSDEAIKMLEDASNEFKTIIKKVDNDCSRNIYPQIVPHLKKYAREIVKSPELLVEFFDDFYNVPKIARDKHVEASALLRKTLKKCATNSKKQDCIDRFVRN